VKFLKKVVFQFFYIYVTGNIFEVPIDFKNTNAVNMSRKEERLIAIIRNCKCFNLKNNRFNIVLISELVEIK